MHLRFRLLNTRLIHYLGHLANLWHKSFRQTALQQRFFFLLSLRRSLSFFSYVYPFLFFFILCCSHCEIWRKKIKWSNSNTSSAFAFFPHIFFIEYTFFITKMQCELEYKSHQLYFLFFRLCSSWFPFKWRHRLMHFSLKQANWFLCVLSSPKDEHHFPLLKWEK